MTPIGPWCTWSISWKWNNVKVVSNLGKDADNVVVSTNINEDDRNRYKDVMAKFDDHFKIGRNLCQVYLYYC